MKSQIRFLNRQLETMHKIQANLKNAQKRTSGNPIPDNCNSFKYYEFPTGAKYA